MTIETSSIGFDPPDSAQYAAEAAAPILGAGPPRGQDEDIRYSFVCCGCAVSFSVVFSLSSLQYFFDEKTGPLSKTPDDSRNTCVCVTTLG